MNIFLGAPRQAVVTAPSNSSGLTDSERQLPSTSGSVASVVQNTTRVGPPPEKKTKRSTSNKPIREQNLDDDNSKKKERTKQLATARKRKQRGLLKAALAALTESGERKSVGEAM